MWSAIWLPDLLLSLNTLSSLFSIRLNLLAAMSDTLWSQIIRTDDNDSDDAADLVSLETLQLVQTPVQLLQSLHRQPDIGALLCNSNSWDLNKTKTLFVY